MNLIDALKAEPQRKCSYAKLLEELKPEEAEALKFAVRNPAKSLREIRDILAANGHIIGRETLAQHRQGKCPSCASA